MTLREKTRLFKFGEYEIHLNFANVLFVYDARRQDFDFPRLKSRNGRMLGNDPEDSVIYPGFRNVPKEVTEQVLKVLLKKRRFGGDGNDRFFMNEEPDFEGFDYIRNHEIFEGPPPPLFFSQEDRIKNADTAFDSRNGLSSFRLDPCFA